MFRTENDTYRLTYGMQSYRVLACALTYFAPSNPLSIRHPSRKKSVWLLVDGGRVHYQAALEKKNLLCIQEYI